MSSERIVKEAEREEIQHEILRRSGKEREKLVRANIKSWANLDKMEPLYLQTYT